MLATESPFPFSITIIFLIFKPYRFFYSPSWGNQNQDFQEANSNVEGAGCPPWALFPYGRSLRVLLHQPRKKAMWSACATAFTLLMLAVPVTTVWGGASSSPLCSRIPLVVLCPWSYWLFLWGWMKLGTAYFAIFGDTTFLLKIFVSMFIKNIGLNFPSCKIFVWCLYLGNAGLVTWVWVYFFFHFLKESEMIGFVYF